MDIERFFSVKPWPHQLRGVEQAIEKIKPGSTICVTSPTGGGKSKMMEAIVRYGLAHNMKVDLKVCRKLLRDQLMDVFSRAGIRYGVRAAGFDDQFDPSQPVQICSTPTENARINKEDSAWETTGADIILVDEAHMQVGAKFIELLKRQAEEGACVIGFTATPIGISGFYRELVVAGTNSELRGCKAHVPAIVKAPFEFDLHKIGRNAIGEYNAGEVTKKIYSTAVVGKIFDNWRGHNPEARPTLIFAPDVAASIWLAEDFTARGVRAAHIDAKQVWYDGELHNDHSGEKRKKIIEMFREGDIQVLSNRYVMREGIDLPEIYNLIIATPFGSLKTYLQSVGRVIRYSSETPDHVLICDHGGNYYEHGSPNMDRDWEEIFWLTEEELHEQEKKKTQEQEEGDMPITCPKCGLVRKSGSRCPEPPIGCGEEGTFRGKIVIQKDGNLEFKQEAQIIKEKQPPIKTPQQLWDALFWAARNSKSNRATSFKQARVLFKKKYGFYPPYGLRNMPRLKCHEAKAIRDISFNDLI